MIRLTRLDGTHFFLNAELIESVESTPDTVIRLSTQRRLMVLESPREVAAEVLRYRRRVGGRTVAARRESGQ